MLRRGHPRPCWRGVMLGMLIFLFLLLALLGYLVGVYNALVRVRAAVKLAWSNIDVLLQQRHDELPKLVETCRQYMQYERDTLEKVMLARAAVNAANQRRDMTALGNAENQLQATLGRLYAVAENYPQLKADQSFQQL